MVSLTCPVCAAEVKPEDLICFTCGANLPRRRPDEDPPAAATVMQEYLRPQQASGSISSAVLRLVFPTGNVDIPAGNSVILGRDPAQSLVAAAFDEYDEVAGRHAMVMVDDGGRASIRDEGSANGTFVNGDRVLPGAEVRLVDGDQIRLEGNVPGDISLPEGA